MLDRSKIPHGSGAKQRGRPQPLSASSSCECQPHRHTVCIHLAPKSRRQRLRRRAAATLLDRSKIPHGSSAKQRGWRQPLSASSSCECRPGRHTVCIHLALKNRRQRLRRRAAASLLDLSKIPDGSSAKQRGWRQPLSGKQLVRVAARQTNSLHLSRTKEQPQACSIGRRPLMAPVQSKEEGRSLCPASSSCECRPGRQTVCIHLAPKSRRQRMRRKAAANFLDRLELPQ